MADGSQRLRALLAAGLVDSFGLALGWTVFNLRVIADQGLAAAGFYNAALFLGVGLSAPVTSLLAERLDGRGLLRVTGAVELCLRVGMFALLLAGAPAPLVALAVAGSSLAAWAGFAGMRAEVAAVDPRPRAMTRYVGSIVAIEAAGAAVAALLPSGSAVLWAVLAIYAGSLLPTFRVAADARVPRARPDRLLAPARRNLRPIVGSFGVMAVASGPTLLAVALTAELYGRLWVAAGAVAFTLGALVAPGLAETLLRRGIPAAVLWPLLGLGMIAGWVAAPWGVASLVVAQAYSGFFLATFEGITDARVAVDESTTSGLGWTASARALGSALSVGLLPGLLGLWSLSAVCAGGCVLLGAAAVGALALAPVRQPSPDLA